MHIEIQKLFNDEKKRELLKSQNSELTDEMIEELIKNQANFMEDKKPKKIKKRRKKRSKPSFMEYLVYDLSQLNKEDLMQIPVERLFTFIFFIYLPSFGALRFMYLLMFQINIAMSNLTDPNLTPFQELLYYFLKILTLLEIFGIFCWGVKKYFLKTQMALFNLFWLLGVISGGFLVYEVYSSFKEIFSENDFYQIVRLLFWFTFPYFGSIYFTYCALYVLNDPDEIRKRRKKRRENRRIKRRVRMKEDEEQVLGTEED